NGLFINRSAVLKFHAWRQFDVPGQPVCTCLPTGGEVWLHVTGITKKRPKGVSVQISEPVLLSTEGFGRIKCSNRIRFPGSDQRACRVGRTGRCRRRWRGNDRGN